MLRYLTYLAIYIPIQLFTYLITPLLPLLSKQEYGSIDNNNSFALEPRLPNGLSWFMTPDNSLLGDNNWKAKTDGKYLSQVIWLYRNSLYGFKWSVLARRMDSERVVRGEPRLDYKGPTYGLLRISCGDLWQYKRVLSLTTNYCLVLNFGWLLDDPSQEKALYMFSPRIKKVQYGQRTN